MTKFVQLKSSGNKQTAKQSERLKLFIQETLSKTKGTRKAPLNDNFEKYKFD